MALSNGTGTIADPLATIHVLQTTTHRTESST